MMRELLGHIRTQIIAAVPGIRAQDIFLVLEPNVLPSGARLPCVGIRGGRTTISERAAGARHRLFEVTVFVFDRLAANDWAINAFLDLTQAISAQLSANLLGGFVADVEPESETAVDILTIAGNEVMRKGLEYRYFIEQ